MLVDDGMEPEWVIRQRWNEELNQRLYGRILADLKREQKAASAGMYKTINPARIARPGASTRGI